MPPRNRILLGVAFVLIGIIAVAAIYLIFPSYPSLTLEFQIVSGSNPALTVLQKSYGKLSYIAASGLPLGNITLSAKSVNGSVTPYFVSISVQYGNDELSQRPFHSLGEGIYQIRVVYGPIAEDASTPYYVLLLFEQGSTVISYQTTRIYPS